MTTSGLTKQPCDKVADGGLREFSSSGNSFSTVELQVHEEDNTLFRVPSTE